MIGTEPDSDDSVLLADVKITFEARDADRLSSEEICEALVAMEGRPWAEYGKALKQISKNQLAKRASAWLHRGACEDAWRAACDVDDLTIPYLDRRPEAQA
jgi:hypothetical protein